MAFVGVLDTNEDDRAAHTQLDLLAVVLKVCHPKHNLQVQKITLRNPDVLFYSIQKAMKVKQILQNVSYINTKKSATHTKQPFVSHRKKDFSLYGMILG